MNNEPLQIIEFSLFDFNSLITRKLQFSTQKHAKFYVSIQYKINSEQSEYRLVLMFLSSSECFSLVTHI